MSIFNGFASALITPFTFDGSAVDFDALKSLIDFQLENNASAIVILGTTGEASTMTNEEKIAVVEYAVKYINKKVPVIVGSGSNDTATAIKNAVLFEKLGADALLIVTPYYNKCTQGGLVAHYTEIAKSVKLPIILYNVPSRTGVNILPATVKELCKIENIVAIKEASGNIEQIMEIKRLCADEIDIYSGDDGLTFPILCLGGKGVISVIGNIMPKKMAQLCEEYFKGNIDSSRDIQLNILPLIKLLFIEVNPIPIKTAVNLLYKKGGVCRLPLTKMEEANIEKLKLELQKFF